MVQIIETLAFPTRENVFRFDNLDARTGVTTVQTVGLQKKTSPRDRVLRCFCVIYHWNFCNCTQGEKLLLVLTLQTHEQDQKCPGFHATDGDRVARSGRVRAGLQEAPSQDRDNCVLPSRSPNIRCFNRGQKFVLMPSCKRRDISRDRRCACTCSPLRTRSRWKCLD